jgi:hypothetical protein
VVLEDFVVASLVSVERVEYRACIRTVLSRSDGTTDPADTGADRALGAPARSTALRYDVTIAQYYTMRAERALPLGERGGEA